MEKNCGEEIKQEGGPFCLLFMPAWLHTVHRQRSVLREQAGAEVGLRSVVFLWGQLRKGGATKQVPSRNPPPQAQSFGVSLLKGRKGLGQGGHPQQALTQHCCQVFIAVSRTSFKEINP